MPGVAEYDAALARKLKLKESKAAAAATAAAAAAAVAGVAAATADVGVAVVIEASERTLEEVFDWKKDRAERARRLWEWWVPRLGDFSFWPTALRLVERGRLAALLAAQAHPRAGRRVGA